MSWLEENAREQLDGVFTAFLQFAGQGGDAGIRKQYMAAADGLLDVMTVSGLFSADERYGYARRLNEARHRKVPAGKE